MPTQEEINAANVELQIANDNYAALANKYNNYMAAFKGYADASPETKAKLQGTMERALADFDQLKLNMYAAEDRIAQAQNRVNSYANIQPVVVTPAWGQRRRQVVVPETVIEPAPTQEVVVPAWGFWWDGWVNNNGTLVSPDWATKVYPDWSISFGGVWAEPRNQSYYDVYAQMKWTWTPSADIANWFRWGLGTANNRNAYQVRQDLTRRWLTNQQINDFIQDWWNATLAPINVQYRLDSPQRIRTRGSENRPAIRTRGNWTGTLI